jgi:hypothetical protein
MTPFSGLIKVACDAPIMENNKNDITIPTNNFFVIFNLLSVINNQNEQQLSVPVSLQVWL